jgi:hypothetical protein
VIAGLIIIVMHRDLRKDGLGAADGPIRIQGVPSDAMGISAINRTHCCIEKILPRNIPLIVLLIFIYIEKN